MSYDYTLDTCGMRCPLPLLKAKKKLSEMSPNEKLCVIASDPDAERDFLLYAQQAQDIVLKKHWQEHHRWYFIITRA